MKEEKALTRVEKPANIAPSGNLKDPVKDALFNMAIETYKDVMLSAQKPADRKAAADAVVELLGRKQSKQVASANFNFNIPPEYFKKVFGEGLPKITTPLPEEDHTDSTNGAPIDAPYRVVSVQGASDGE